MCDTIDAIRNELEARFGDKTIVHGEGNLNPLIMMIGEAPGEKEHIQRRPFVGKAGKNLDEFLNISGIVRSEIYITNAVKFRPTAQGSRGNLINRKPTKDEIEAFRPYLLRELEIVKPRAAVTLGNVPLYALTGENLKIGDVHGKIIKRNGALIYPMYHPASVIYNPALRQTYIDDINALADWIKRDG